jgi:methionyl-tRNA formyltransferase
MRIVFAGTPRFASEALVALHQAGHEIVAVLTQPDRQSGRGLVLSQSPVKQAAVARGLQVLQPVSLREGKPGADEAVTTLESLVPDLMVVAAYGLILPLRVLNLPRFGCLNIHASLLPRWRGAAPIQRAIAAGDKRTGIALMQMEEGLDTGPVWEMIETPIHSDDTFERLHDRLSQLGAQAVVDLLKQFPPAGRAPTPQSEAGVTYAHKIDKHDTLIDWARPAEEIARQIRALDPVPGAQAFWQGAPVKLFGATAVADPLKNDLPGQILRADREALLIACGQGAVQIEALQRAGAKRQGFREFLNGQRVRAGQQFESIQEA